MTLELMLADPPFGDGWNAWPEGPASAPELTDEQLRKLIQDNDSLLHAGQGSLVLTLGVTPPWWASLPPRSHLHLTDAAADAVTDGMAAVGMMTHTVLVPEAFKVLDTPDAESHARFLEADSGAPGIPQYKLDTRHKWVVTPREIYVALATHATGDGPEADIKRLLGPESLPLWERWLAYLRLASLHGGFRVEGGSLVGPHADPRATA